MPIKKYKPTTPGRRKSSVQRFDDVTATKPEKSLTRPWKERGGRSLGRITVRHRGGGHKKQYRVIDYLREKFDIPAVIKTIEYDPHRGARIALVAYADGVKRYIIAPDAVKVGDKIITTKTADVEMQVGNRLPLERIPLGAVVHAVELEPNSGAKIARGAGASIQLMAVEGKYATLKMPSGEIRNVSRKCMATIGTVSNQDWRLVRWGKAGRTRYRGIKPTVRGKVMNPVDHPHGGGEAKNPIGMKHPKTPWGKPALGVKTRRKNRQSDSLILQRRRNKRKK
ncbi:MAG: 50S ribosomal protein L2 [Patescibacteria group bacterium]|nr:50S ribosomal protein L2 [Patescibacteria group bacterium]